MLNCCYSLDGDVVAETLLVLRGLVDSLRWPQSSSFLAQLTFTLGPFFEAVRSSDGVAPASGLRGAREAQPD